MYILRKNMLDLYTKYFYNIIYTNVCVFIYNKYTQ